MHYFEGQIHIILIFLNSSSLRQWTFSGLVSSHDVTDVGQLHRNGNVVKVTNLVVTGTLKLAFRVSIDDEGSHPDDLQDSVSFFW